MRNMGVVRASVGVLAAALVLVVIPMQSSGGGNGPFQFHSLTPCRLVDTRLPAYAPALADNTERTFDVQGQCGVPDGAAAVTVNSTGVGPNGNGFLTLFPNGITRPVVSNLNYQAGVPAIGNGAIVPLGAFGSFPNNDLKVYARVSAAGGTVHFVLDVTGYFQ